jgi:hypothetical protein
MKDEDFPDQYVLYFYNYFLGFPSYFILYPLSFLHHTIYQMFAMLRHLAVLFIANILFTHTE